MSQKSRNKKQKPFNTLFTVVVTLLVAAIVVVFFYALRTFGFSTHTVTYTVADTDVTGSLPERRRFEKGEEVVVRAGVLTKKDHVFVGWKDIDEVIENSGEVLQNGTVFIMPKKDVTLEAVWEEEGASDDDSTNETSNSSTGSGKKTDGKIYVKKDGKDYINVRSSYTHESDVVTKVSSADTEIHYAGKSENVFSEDDNKTYTWYFVTIPDSDKEGWIRSDMLTQKSGGSSDSGDDDNTSDNKKAYIKSSKYDSISVYEDADSSSEVLEDIDDEEAELYFTGDTEDVTDDGDTVTWYSVETESGTSGWVQKSKITAKK